MSKIQTKSIIIFILGMLTFAIGAFLVNIFFLVERPQESSIIEDWDQICLWQDVDGIYLSVSPMGCFSTSCTQIKQQIGTVMIDLENEDIFLDAHFVLQKTTRFPLPCTENCSGGGRIQFKFDQLIPNDYSLWFKDQKVGKVNIFSGRTTPNQCFNNPLD